MNTKGVYNMAYKTLGIDTSHWEPNLDAKKLRGLDFIIGRIGTQWINLAPQQWMDATGPVHCQVAYDIVNEEGTKQGVPYGEFFYDDWTYWLDMQWNLSKVRNLTPDTDPRITATRRALFSGDKLRTIHFIGIDVEQAPHEGMSQTDNYANWISDSAKSYVDCLLYMMQSGELPIMPIFLYSRKTYIDQWCKLPDGTCPLTNWMHNYQANLGPGRFFDWIADWSYSRADANVVYTAISAKANTLPLDTYHPASISDWPDIIWQCGGDAGANRVHMVGVTDERNIPLVVDVNTLLIEKEAFYSLLKFVPRDVTIEPEPDPAEYLTVTVLGNGLRERTQPNALSTTPIVGNLKTGDIVEVLERKIVDADNIWVRTRCQDVWVAQKYKGYIYAK
jgi:hypothetical protein